MIEKIFLIILIDSQKIILKFIYSLQYSHKNLKDKITMNILAIYIQIPIKTELNILFNWIILSSFHFDNKYIKDILKRRNIRVMNTIMFRKAKMLIITKQLWNGIP